MKARNDHAAHPSAKELMAAVIAVPKAEVDDLEAKRVKRPSPRTLAKTKNVKRKNQKGAA